MHNENLRSPKPQALRNEAPSLHFIALAAVYVQAKSHWRVGWGQHLLILVDRELSILPLLVIGGYSLLGGYFES